MNVKEVNEAISFYIRPQTFPVAIRLYEKDEKIPEKVRVPSRDLGTAIPLCQAVALSRRYGWTLALGREDESCPHGYFVLGFTKGESYLNGSSGEAAGVGTREEVEMITRNVTGLPYGKYHAVVTAPLQNCTFEPHVVVIYGEPAQVVRLIQGWFLATGKPVTTPMFGGVACGAYLARTILTDEPQVVVSGAGDRFFALAQDNEMAFSIPWSKSELVVKGLEMGHKRGWRFPTPFMFRFADVLPPAYYKWTEILREEESKA
ncbi:MAG: DUF169 domain-containing protein [Syntrophales bacterium]|nr:DUF169 domain-containing protein [Syntrophales bacterium]